MPKRAIRGFFCFRKTERMEKELLISKIKEKIGTTKISEQTMDAYVASILPTIANDEMVNDAFLEGCKAFLVAARGQMTNEAAEEIRRYKENHPAPTPTPTPAPAPTPEPKPNNGDEAMEKLLKEFEDLKKSIGEDAKRRKQEQLMHDVMERMKAEGADDEYVLKNAMRGITLDETKSVDELAAAYLPNYDKEYREARGDSGMPRGGSGGGERSKKALDDFFDQKRAEGKFPSKE